ncbi:MAG: DUF5700 domain-containing putative Zn-dependent protease [Candidatus Bipolaricaulia bacterium]
MLEAHAAQAGGLDDLAQLQKLVSIEDARFLFNQLVELRDPTEIERLKDYGKLQNEWGGSFYGMLPEPLTEGEIPVPADFPSLTQVAALLSRVRAENHEALKQVNPAYPIGFKGQFFPSMTLKNRPERWDLELDLSGIRAVLRLFRQERISREDAAAVAALAPYTEMIKHRENLGYLPKPWLTQDGLTNLLYHAASRAPLDMIWKWLTSQNFFDFADIALHQQDYEILVNELDAHAEEIKNQILGTIAQYAPDEMRQAAFQDRVSFTVGWGISGWATATTGGINIEHFKDDYDRLLTTLTHETFHRFQLQVCPTDPTREGKVRSFEDLTHFSFDDEADRKFYEVISYILLEGTATYLAPAHPPVDLEKSVNRGAQMLQECFEAIYQHKDPERAEELLSQGLKSNGPVYWFGAHMAEKIVERYGDAGLGESLLEGSPGFFVRYLAAEAHAGLRLGREIESKVRELAATMSKL